MISALDRNVVEEHILTRLDGVSLSSFSCTSSYYNTLSSRETLWRKICTSTCPSLNHPRVSQLISGVPKAHSRLFYDSFPLLLNNDQLRNRNRPSSLPYEIISAVDIWYRDEIVLSRVVETDTKSGLFSDSPFRVDLFDPKEARPSPTRVNMAHYDNNDDSNWVSPREVEENMTVSWIIFDPNTKRSANFSSTSALSMERHWIPGAFDVEYGAVLGCDRVGYVECKVVVTCEGMEHGELHVREACMQLKDIDGKNLNGKDSLVCLVNAIEFGERKKGGEKEGVKMHQEFLKRKRLRLEKRVLREWKWFVVLVVLCLWPFAPYTL